MEMSKDNITKDDLMEHIPQAERVYDGERQHFNNIKSIEAVNGYVVFKIQGKPGEGDKGPQLFDKRLSVREAAERARSLNQMASKFPEKDRKVALDIVDDVIAKCLEAREQLVSLADM